MTKQKIVGIIPSRYASNRFPGKPLVNIANKPMIQRVYEQSLRCQEFDKVIVATDDERIAACVQSFGGKVMMTSPHHQNGTERCEEVSKQIEADYYVNIQGDEPFIKPEQLSTLCRLLDGKTSLATLVKKISDPALLDNPNIIKVVIDQHHEAIYFSRNCIPYSRNKNPENRLKTHDYYKHIGVYAYQKQTLPRISRMPMSRLEQAESLEQLRWIENGLRIKVAETEIETIGIDVVEDIEKALKLEKLA